jgi:hypothetical protein
VHPAVFESYLAGTLLETLQNGTKQAAKNDAKNALSSEEAAVVRLLLVSSH